MSKERETLITDLSIGAVDGFFYITQKLQAEIRELLTQKRKRIDTRRITLEMYSDGIDINYKDGYVDGIRFAEKMHGLGGEE